MEESFVPHYAVVARRAWGITFQEVFWLSNEQAYEKAAKLGQIAFAQYSSKREAKRKALMEFAYENNMVVVLIVAILHPTLILWRLLHIIRSKLGRYQTP